MTREPLSHLNQPFLYRENVSFLNVYKFYIRRIIIIGRRVERVTILYNDNVCRVYIHYDLRVTQRIYLFEYII